MTGPHFTPESLSRVRLQRTICGLAALAAISVSVYWLTADVISGLRSGRDSDLHRRWVVCQYVLKGIDPYPLALAALQNRYGPLGAGRAKPRVYAVPHLRADAVPLPAPVSALLDSRGTPEAVYPPSADLLLSLTLGPVSERWVHRVGMVVNLSLLVVFTALLGRLVPAEQRSSASVLLTLALLLSFSPTRTAVLSGQFSILVTVSLLLAFRDLTRHEYRAGAWLALALIKPSMALPFLILPLVRGRWRALAVAIGFHAVATTVQTVRFGIAPWDLLRQWTGVAAYFTQGQFTLQEALSALRLADTAAGFAVVGAVVLFAVGWCLWNRAADDDVLIDWLCFVSVLWSYHGAYDFVVLLIPLARRLTPAAAAATKTSGSFFSASLAAGLFICLSVAASPLAYSDEVHVAARILRHAARLALVLSAAAVALDAWRLARRAEAEHQPAGRHPPASREHAVKVPA